MLLIDHLTGIKFSVFKNKVALDRFESLLAEQYKKASKWEIIILEELESDNGDEEPCCSVNNIHCNNYFTLINFN